MQMDSVLGVREEIKMENEYTAKMDKVVDRYFWELNSLESLDNVNPGIRKTLLKVPDWDFPRFVFISPYEFNGKVHSFDQEAIGELQEIDLYGLCVKGHEELKKQQHILIEEFNHPLRPFVVAEAEIENLGSLHNLIRRSIVAGTDLKLNNLGYNNESMEFFNAQLKPENNRDLHRFVDQMREVSFAMKR